MAPEAPTHDRQWPGPRWPKYPGATVLRVETDSDGVYEAHLTTSGGQRVTVEVDKSLKVTGEESGPGRP